MCFECPLATESPLATHMLCYAKVGINNKLRTQVAYRGAFRHIYLFNLNMLNSPIHHLSFFVECGI